MTILIIFIIAMSLFQTGIFLFSWKRRRNPLLLLPRGKRTQLMIDLLKIRNQLESIGVFSEVLLGKHYGQLNLSQMEFVNQVNEATHNVLSKIRFLTGTKGGMSSTLLTPLINTGSPNAEEQIESTPSQPLTDHLQTTLQQEKSQSLTEHLDTGLQEQKQHKESSSENSTSA